MDGNRMNCKRGKKSVSLVDLDNDILVWILTRLPITTIIRCKRVCKSWYLFISSSYFADSYRANSPFTNLVISNGEFMSLLELNPDCNYSVKPKILPRPFGSSTKGTRLVGSCNGFLCFVQSDLVNVRNPLSEMSFMLPNQQLLDCNRAPRLYGSLKKRTCYGFGFCPKTQQYKVVEIAKYDRSSRTELNIFTLGIDKSWRRLVNEYSPFTLVAAGNTAWCADFSMPFCQVNGKGALHWIVGKMAKVDYLYSFDISEEKVRPVPTPLGLKKRNSYTKSVFLHGCLCLLHRNEEETIEFWCMKDYMVQDSWTLRIIPQICFPGYIRYGWFHTVAVWKKEEVLMALQSNSIHCYNLKKENVTNIKIVVGDTSPEYHVATYFVPNFFPFLEAGTAVAQTQDAVKEQGLLMPEVSKLTQLGDGSV